MRATGSFQAFVVLALLSSANLCQAGWGGGGPAPPPNGEGIPDGTYLGSCMGCNLVEEGTQERYDAPVGTLSCSHCTKPCGAKVPSEIDVSTCEGMDITNDGGALQCAPKEVLDPNLPEGTYTGSCTGCTVDTATDVLACTCGKPDGTTAETTLTIGACEGGPITNAAGELACEDEAAAPSGDRHERSDGADETSDDEGADADAAAADEGEAGAEGEGEGEGAPAKDEL